MNYRHNEKHHYQQHLKKLILQLQNSQLPTITIHVLHNYTNIYHGAQIKKNLFVAMI